MQKQQYQVKPATKKPVKKRSPQYLQRQEEKIKIKKGYVLCEICYEYCEKIETLEPCGHQFCKSCLKQSIEMHLRHKKTGPECMVCPEESCQKLISFTQILNLYKFYHILDSFYERGNFARDRLPSYQTHKFIICQTQNCGKVFIYHKNQKKEILCKKCMINYDPVTQLQKTVYKQSDIQQMAEFRLINLMRCPACSFWVERIDGCNHMECRCGYSFCYDCGQNMYSQKHYYCGVNMDPIQRKVLDLCKVLVKDFPEEDERKQKVINIEKHFKQQLEYYDQYLKQQEQSNRAFYENALKKLRETEQQQQQEQQEVKA